MRILIIGVLSLLSVACASPRWSKTGVTEDVAHQDYIACRLEAAKATAGGVVATTNPIALGQAEGLRRLREGEIIRDCMLLKGYHRES